MKPTVGRIVHYISEGKNIAAIVCEVKENDSCLLYVLDPDKGVKFKIASPGEWVWPKLEQTEEIEIIPFQLKDYTEQLQTNHPAQRFEDEINALTATIDEVERKVKASCSKEDAKPKKQTKKKK